LILNFREEHFKAKRAHLSSDHTLVMKNDNSTSLNNNLKHNELIEIEIEEVLSFYGKIDDKKFLSDVEKVKFKVSLTGNMINTLVKRFQQASRMCHE
jgi:hypothetical protein